MVLNSHWTLILLWVRLFSVPVFGISDSQKRIVDAREIQSERRYSFLAIFNFQPSKYARCTASIISPYWVISASHCLGSKERISVKDCGTRIHPKIPLECEEIPESGDLKIIPVSKDPSGVPEVLVGVHSVYEKLTPKSMRKVEYLIRPKKAYQGGHYGKYGGYDLILIKMKKPANGRDPICLPLNGNYLDLGSSTIAGYGRYKRPPCETGSLGPEKFEFCGLESGCVKGSRIYGMASCNIEFPYKGKSVTGCLHDPTPSFENPICKHFLRTTGFKFTNETDEVAILSSGLSGPYKKVVTKCYRESPLSYGWCGTVRDFQDFRRQNVSVSLDSGWGYCQRSCFLRKEAKLGGIERFKDVDVVSEEYCYNRLTSGRVQYVVEPRVLCVAFNKTYKTSFYEAVEKSLSETTYKELKGSRELHKLLGRNEQWYIHGTGSCGGDSGGPLFKTCLFENQKPIFVLTGVTSRGTGRRGNCGGLDNPTHYVRIKYFIDWITKYIPKDQLCLISHLAQEELKPPKHPVSPDYIYVETITKVNVSKSG